MVTTRFHRLLLSGGLAAAIALGGYYTGYAKTKAQESTPKLQNAEFLQKLPPDIGLTMALEHADEAGITPDEVRKLREGARALVPAYLDAQRKIWDRRLRKATLAEEGKFLTSTGDPIAGGAVEFYEMREDDKIMTEPNARLEMFVFKTIGRERMTKLRELRKAQRLRDSVYSFNFLFEPETPERLGLSEAQSNQLILFEAYHAFQLSHPGQAPKEAFYLDKVLLQREVNRKIVASAKPSFKEGFFHEVRNRLSPLQQARLDTILRNRLYVGI